MTGVAKKLWELELSIHRVKVSTSPDGKAVNLFFVTDNRYCCCPRKHLRFLIFLVDPMIAESGGVCSPIM